MDSKNNFNDIIENNLSEGWNSFVVKKDKKTTKYFLNGKLIFSN